MRKRIGVVSLLCITVMFFIALVMICSCSAVEEDTVLFGYEETEYTLESVGIRPEDDFYGYINFDFLWNNEIPSDMLEYSTLEIISSNIDKQLEDEIMRIVSSDEDYAFGSDEQKIKDFYYQYVNTKERDKMELGVLSEGILAIESANDMDEFVSACGVLYKDFGCSVLFLPYVSEDYYDSSKYSLYLGQMDLMYSAEELLYTDGKAEDAQELMEKLLLVYGAENADETAYKMVNMILDIAVNTEDIREYTVEKAYNECTVEELQKLLTNIDVRKMTESFGIDFTDTYIVFDPKQMETINKCFSQENLDLWKNYAMCRLFYDYRDYLPEKYRKLFYASSYESVEERAISAIKNELPGEVGNIYTKKYIDKENVNTVIELTLIIKEAYANVIRESESLDEDVKEKLLLKLENMLLNIGCSSETYHSESVISGSLLESCVSIKRTGILENLSLYDKDVERNTWYITPWTVNAVYYTKSNSITIPAALFQNPIFNNDGDLYKNLGGLGMIIAHEMTHAFDKEGVKYDENGCYNPHWIGFNEDQRMQKIEESVGEYFGNQIIMDSHYIDGKLTVNENIADLGAMEVISSITDDKMELQSIFESYAVLWATLSYDTVIAEQILTDVHSPAEIRVNGVLSSIDKFYLAYDIMGEDEMYILPEERARVWQ